MYDDESTCLKEGRLDRVDKFEIAYNGAMPPMLASSLPIGNYILINPKSKKEIKVSRDSTVIATLERLANQKPEVWSPRKYIFEVRDSRVGVLA